MARNGGCSANPSPFGNCRKHAASLLQAAGVDCKRTFVIQLPTAVPFPYSARHRSRWSAAALDNAGRRGRGPAARAKPPRHPPLSMPPPPRRRSAASSSREAKPPRSPRKQQRARPAPARGADPVSHRPHASASKSISGTPLPPAAAAAAGSGNRISVRLFSARSAIETRPFCAMKSATARISSSET